jgi:hypothetical protein
VEGPVKFPARIFVILPLAALALRIARPGRLIVHLL